MHTRALVWLLLGAIALLGRCGCYPQTMAETESDRADCTRTHDIISCQNASAQEMSGMCWVDPNGCLTLEPALAAQVLPSNCRAQQYNTNLWEHECATWIAEAAIISARAASTATPQTPGIKPVVPLAVAVVPRAPDTPTFTPTATNTPTPVAAIPPEAAAPPPACSTPPTLFDPPDGKSFAARSTVFRWKPDFQLTDDEVFDVLISTDGGKTFQSVGTTRDTNLPVDFVKWSFAGVTGGFSWTVRVKDASGEYVTCEPKWFAMTLTEIPPANKVAPVGPPKPCHDPPKCSY